MKPPVITEEDWLAWRENPITQLVMSGLSNMANEAKQRWQDGAWSAEYLTADEREKQLLALNRVKSQAASYAEMTNITLQDVLAANGLEEG